MRTSRDRASRELHEDVVRSIEVEIASGRSHRAIAAATGVNRKTVDLIAAGQHVSQVRGRRFERCSEGHLSLAPCRTCTAREALANPKTSAA